MSNWLLSPIHIERPYRAAQDTQHRITLLSSSWCTVGSSRALSATGNCCFTRNGASRVDLPSNTCLKRDDLKPRLTYVGCHILTASFSRPCLVWIILQDEPIHVWPINLLQYHVPKGPAFHTVTLLRTKERLSLLNWSSIVVR